MRITDPGQISSLVPQPGPSGVKSGGAVGSGSVPASLSSSGNSDQVSLSGVSQLLRGSSLDRASQIAALRAQVAAGQYDVSSSQVSQSIVTEMMARAANS